MPPPDGQKRKAGAGCVSWGQALPEGPRYSPGPNERAGRPGLWTARHLSVRLTCPIQLRPSVGTLRPHAPRQAPGPSGWGAQARRTGSFPGASVCSSDRIPPPVRVRAGEGAERRGYVPGPWAWRCARPGTDTPVSPSRAGWGRRRAQEPFPRLRCRAAGAEGGARGVLRTQSAGLRGS